MFTRTTPYPPQMPELPVSSPYLWEPIMTRPAALFAAVLAVITTTGSYLILTDQNPLQAPTADPVAAAAMDDETVTAPDGLNSAEGHGERVCRAMTRTEEER